MVLSGRVRPVGMCDDIAEQCCGFFCFVLRCVALRCFACSACSACCSSRSIDTMDVVGGEKDGRVQGQEEGDEDEDEALRLAKRGRAERQRELSSGV